MVIFTCCECDVFRGVHRPLFVGAAHAEPVSLVGGQRVEGKAAMLWDKTLDQSHGTTVLHRPVGRLAGQHSEEHRTTVTTTPISTKTKIGRRKLINDYTLQNVFAEVIQITLGLGEDYRKLKLRPINTSRHPDTESELTPIYNI